MDELFSGISYSIIIVLFFASVYGFVHEWGGDQVLLYNKEKAITQSNEFFSLFHNKSFSEACNFIEFNKGLKLVMNSVSCSNLFNVTSYLLEFPISLEDGNGRVFVQVRSD